MKFHLYLKELRSARFKEEIEENLAYCEDS